MRKSERGQNGCIEQQHQKVCNQEDYVQYGETLHANATRPNRIRGLCMRPRSRDKEKMPEDKSHPVQDTETEKILEEVAEASTEHSC